MKNLILSCLGILLLSFQCGKDYHEYRDTIIEGTFTDENGNPLPNFEFFFSYRDLSVSNHYDILPDEVMKITNTQGNFKICPDNLKFDSMNYQPVLIFKDTTWKFDHVDSLGAISSKPFVVVQMGYPNWNRIKMGKIMLHH